MPPQAVDQRKVNLHVRVVRILQLVVGSSEGVAPQTSQILESLLWTFLAWFRMDPKTESRFVRSLRDTLGILTSLRDEKDSDQTFCKAWLNYLMCSCVGHVLGDAPRPEKPLFVGCVWKLVRRFLARRDSSFFYSLLQSKRFYPELGDRKKIEAMTDAQKRLLEPPPSKLSVEAENEILETAAAVFAGLGPPTKMSPSSSACCQATVREGGAYSLYAPMSDPEPRMGPLRDLLLQHELWKAQTFDHADLNSRHILLGMERSRCQIVIIPEPSKFRIISKGDGYLYTRLQPLQGAMLQAWKRVKYATMRENLDEKVGVLAKSPESLWCSGDFKAATDTLDQLCSLAVATAVDQVIDSRVCRQAFRASELSFPDGTVGVQWGGQLMGHPLSFPVLCVVNLALYRVAVKRFCREVRCSRERRRRLLNDVLINGDDILFKCERRMYDIWAQTVSEAGLIISPGKNYLSERFCTINSRLYEDFGGRVVRRGYINLKLVKGFSLKTGESHATPDQLGRDISEMVRYCPQAVGVIPACFARFRYVGWTPNWYLPVTLGGYGVDPSCAPDNVRITRQQRVMAAVFRNEKLSLFKRFSDERHWQLPDFRRFLPSFDWVPSSTVVEAERSDDWTGRLAEIAYAMKGGLWIAAERETSVVVQAARLRKSKKFSPMSIASVIEHWSDFLLARERAPVPPPWILSY